MVPHGLRLLRVLHGPQLLLPLKPRQYVTQNIGSIYLPPN